MSEGVKEDMRSRSKAREAMAINGVLRWKEEKSKVWNGLNMFEELIYVNNELQYNDNAW